METPHRRQDSGARAAAFLVVLAILLVQGAGLMPGRIGLWADARNYGPWSGSVGQNDRPQPTMVLDSLRYSLAEWTLAHEELGKGRLPLWNPYIFSGFDNAGSIQPAVFSPLKIILALLPPGRGMTLHLLLHTLLLGLGTVLLVRGRGGAGSAAAMAGVTVALNGYLVAKMGQPTAVATLGWLPLLLWSQDRFFRRPRRRQAGVLVLLLLAAALAGHPPYFIYMLLTLALFAAASLWRSPPSRERFCSMLVWGGVALALVGVGTSILPVARGWAGRTSRPLATAERPPLTRPAPQALWGLLVPEPMGSAARGSYAPPAVKLPRGETLGIWHAGVFIYPGVLVWLLLPLALTDLRRHPFALEGALLAAGSYAVVYWGPLHRLVQSISFLGFARLDRLLGLGALGLGLLAAAGLQAMVQVPWRRAAVLLAGAGLLQGGLLFCLRLWPVSPAGTGVVRTALVAAVGVGVLLVVLLQRQLRPWVVWLPVALLMVDLVLVARPYYRTVPQAGLFPDTGLVRFLESHLGHDRLFRYGTEDPPPNTLQFFHLRDAQGFAPLYSGHYRRFAALLEPGRRAGSRLVRSLVRPHSLSSPLMQVLGVRYVVSGRRGPPADGWKEVFQAGQESVWESPRRPLRARVVTSWMPAETDEDAAEILARPGFDPARNAVLMASPGQAEPPAPGPGPGTGPGGVVRFLRDSPWRVDLKIRSEKGGLLVLADGYHPAWRAWLQGGEVPVWRADLAFRSVLVPPGASRVSFVYTPRRLQTAALACLLAWLLALGLVFWPDRQAGAGRCTQESKKAPPP